MGAKAMLAQGLALGLMPAFELGVRSPRLSSALGIGYVAALIEFVPGSRREAKCKQTVRYKRHNLYASYVLCLAVWSPVHAGHDADFAASHSRFAALPMAFSRLRLTIFPVQSPSSSHYSVRNSY